MIDKKPENKRPNDANFSINKSEKNEDKSNFNKKSKSTVVDKKTNQEVIFNEIFNELILKKSNLIKEIELLEKQKNNLTNDIESNFSGKSDNIAKRVKGF